MATRTLIPTKSKPRVPSKRKPFTDGESDAFCLSLSQAGLIDHANSLRTLPASVERDLAVLKVEEAALYLGLAISKLGPKAGAIPPVFPRQFLQPK